MKILMKNLAAGPAGVLLPGKTYDLDAAQARELVAGNYAEAVPAAYIAVEKFSLTAQHDDRESVITATAPLPIAEHATAPRYAKRKR